MSSSTTVAFACERCGRGFCVSQQQSGKRARCRTCGHEMRIPAAPPAEHGAPPRANSNSSGEPLIAAAAHARLSDAEMLSFRCDSCGRAYQVLQRMRGKRVRCKSCGATIQIRGGAHDDAAGESDIYGLEQATGPRAPDGVGAVGDADLPAVNRGWMKAEIKAARHSEDDLRRHTGAIRSGLGMLAFGLFATILPVFGFGLRARGGGQTLGPQETVYMGIAIAALGALVAGFSYLQLQRPPKRTKKRRGPSTLFLLLGGVPLGIIVLLIILAAIFRRR